MKREKIRKRIAKNIILMLTTTLLLQPISVWATTPAEESETETGATEKTAGTEGASATKDTAGTEGASATKDTAGAENAAEEETTVQYIVEIESIGEGAGYYNYEEKPALDELTTSFPAEISVRLENAEEFMSLAVTWECGEDYENTESDSYLFYPKWDETLYAIAEDTEMAVEIPSILVEIVAEETWRMIHDLEQAKKDLEELLQEKNVIGLIYLSDAYEVKAGADTEEETVVTVASGQSVVLKDVALDGEGEVWYQVLLYEGGKEYTGYVERGNLVSSDADFLAWAQKYIDLSRVPMFMSSRRSEDVEQFPASYQTALYALKREHPNWIFVKMDTGLDWGAVISNENKDAKNLVSASRPDSWKNGLATQGWYYATEDILKYYIDPRNFLKDPYIFQFEQMNYNASYHTADAVQGMLNGSFMSSAIPGDSLTYAQAFEKIGSELKVSSFHLAARVLQEQGTKGTSPLISGTYSGYEGYYNFFNISASGKTNQEVIENGLKKAKSLGWNTRYKSLYGGSEVIGNNYILCGQDTLYLEKFNVANGRHANFTHQYMQNLEAPYSESQNIRKAYNNAGVLESPFVFKIPVYNNMPSAVCTKPDTKDTVTLDKTSIDNLAVDRTEKMIPYVNGAIPDNISSVVSFESSDAAVATVSSEGVVTAVSPGTATITCKKGNVSASCTVTVIKANPNVEEPVLLPVTYRESLKLSDIGLPEGWAWAKEKTQLVAGTGNYEAVYTPDDTTKYNIIAKEVSLTVSKAIPTYQVPTDVQAAYGSELGQIVLPTGFVWEDDATSKIEKTGTAVYYASYNPNENNYHTINHIPIMIMVVGGVTEGNGEDDVVHIPDNVGGSTGDTSGGTGSTGGTTGGAGNAGGAGGTSDTGNGSSSVTSTQTTGNNGTGNAGNTSNTGSTTSTQTTGNGTSSAGSTTGGAGNVGSTGSTSDTTTQTTGNGTSSTTSTQTTGNNATSSAGSTTGGAGNTGDTSSTGSTSSSSMTSTQTTGNGTSSTTSTQMTGNNGTSSAGSTTGGAGNAGNTSSIGSTSSSSTTSTQTTGNGTSSATNTQTTSINSTNNTSGGTGSNSNANGMMNAQTDSNVTDGAISMGTVKPATVADSNVISDGQNSNILSVGEPETSAEELPYSKPSVTMEMQDTTILTSEQLQMMKEQNLDLVLSMGNQIVWTIDADTVQPEKIAPVDMGVSLAENIIPQELIDELVEDGNYYELSMAHSGDLGFASTLQIPLDSADSGRYANLFEFDSQAQQLNYVASSIIEENGMVSFVIERAADFLITISEQPMTAMPEVNKSSHTMRNWLIAIGCVAVAGAGAAGGVVIYRKRKTLMPDADEEYDEEDEYDEGDGVQEEYNEQEELNDEYEEPDDEFDGYDDSDSYSDVTEKKPARELSIISPVRSVKKIAYSDGDDEYDGYDDSDAQEDSENQYEDFSNLKIAFGKEGDWIEDEEWEKMAQ